MSAKFPNSISQSIPEYSFCTCRIFAIANEKVVDNHSFDDTINGFGISQEPPPESDLTYLDRSRLEEEYRKLKELKKKAEYYAVEAKQTAQRLSAENFKLKEDLSRERHHNELTRKNMIREMEQKMDKSATALDRADARLEVFEQEVNERALQMIRRMSAPTALALQLPGTTSKCIIVKLVSGAIRI